MAGATFSRVKNWAIEVLSNTDLNIEIDNILNNLNTDGMDDYSTNIAQMRLMTDPGEVGTESLATSLSGEIERLRYEIKQIKGGDVDQWYEAASSSLSDLRQLVGGETSSTRISSGLTTGRSSQLNVIIPDGSNDGFHIEGAPTNFIYYIDDVQYIIDDDTVLIDGLVKAPSSNNTATVNDNTATGGEETKLLGEYGTVISVDAMGSGITALTGKTAAFKVVSSGLTEYFTAYVESSTKLRNARRGMFFDSTGTAKPRIPFSDNDVITLMKLTWIFLTSSKTILVAYNEPVYSAIQPDSPSTGDFWFDMVNLIWKRFDGSVYTESAVALIGMSVQDATNCVAARTLTRFANQSDVNTIDLERISATGVRVKNYGAQISVFGTLNRYETYRMEWNMASHLDTGVTEASSTTYYFYVKENGAPVISNLAPHDQRGDLRGLYHPTETWRYVGKCFNDSGSDLLASSLVSGFRTHETKFFSNDMEEVGSIKPVMTTSVAPGWAICEGASISKYLYNELFESGFFAMGAAVGSADTHHFNLPDFKGRFLRGRANTSANDPDRAARTAMATGGNTGDNVGSVQADELKAHTHPVKSAVDANAGGANDKMNYTFGAVGTARTESTGGNETRPINAYVQYVIKVLA